VCVCVGSGFKSSSALGFLMRSMMWQSRADWTVSFPSQLYTRDPLIVSRLVWCQSRCLPTSLVPRCLVVLSGPFDGQRTVSTAPAKPRHTHTRKYV
jgi:hypothetical protein